jgi:hypothetical protein
MCEFFPPVSHAIPAIRAALLHATSFLDLDDDFKDYKYTDETVHTVRCADTSARAFTITKWNYGAASPDNTGALEACPCLFVAAVSMNLRFQSLSSICLLFNLSAGQFENT